MRGTIAGVRRSAAAPVQRRRTGLLLLLLLLPLPAAAQLTPWFQWTFLPQAQMDEIAGEVSGETAFNHVLEMAGYDRDRSAQEYGATFLEAQYLLDRMTEYGIPGAAIVRFPGGRTWDGIAGELWEVSPMRQKLASYTDLRAMLASGSMPADVTAPLVWAGEGRPRDFEGLDVAGKIVVTSGSANAVHRLACLDKDAAGVVSFDSPRPLIDPLSIPMAGIRGTDAKPARFAFLLPPREGEVLRDRLLRGDQITVHARVESAQQAYELQDVVGAIPGTDAGGDEIVLTAHLFEGYVKFGADDNYSGCAVLLETARTLHRLIGEGRLPRPRRTVRFLMTPEFSGTIPWVNANPDVMARTLCNINLDMVGLRLTKSLAFLTVMRTTYGNPHYINDVMENAVRYVGETNRSYVTNSMSGALFRRMVAPSGTEEPMFYYMGTHFGSSDHEVFNDWGVGVPGIVMNTWPDTWYHTSGDRPDKLDPTQLKRSAAIVAAAAYTIASADDRTAAQIAGEIVANGSARLGHQLARGLEELRRADAGSLAKAYAKARGYVRAAAINERATVGSTLELVSDTGRKGFAASIEKLRASVSGVEKAHLQALESGMRAAAAGLGIAPVILPATPLEIRAAKLVPRPTAAVKAGGYRGYQEALNGAIKEAGWTQSGLARGAAAEIQLLCDGRNSALDIKAMLDAQFREGSSLEAVIGYIEVLAKAGLATIRP